MRLSIRIYSLTRYKIRSTSNLSTETTDTLISPVPGRFPPDLKLTIGLDVNPPFLKSSQVVYNSLGLVKALWEIRDPVKLKFPVTFRTHQFFEVAVVITPLSFGEELTAVKVAASLLRGMRYIMGANRPPYGGVFMRMDTLPSRDPLGAIHIYRSIPEANQVSLFNDTLAIAMTPAVSYGGNISTTTGQGLAANSTCTSACPSLAANPARQITVENWLTVFIAPLSAAFTHLPFAPVSAFISASDREKSFFTTNRKVKCVIRFYGTAYDPAEPLTILDFVTGMLEVLHQWAVEDRWREAWGEVQLHGERAATMQISRVDAAVGSAGGLAIS